MYIYYKSIYFEEICLIIFLILDIYYKYYTKKKEFYLNFFLKIIYNYIM